jgi:ABC-2 type transport system ATP-binding protein
MIALHDLRKEYSGREVLRGVSFEIAGGEIFALLGPNGAGKTTTIRILSGLTRADGGSVVLDGRDAFLDPLWARSRCGLVAQTINLDQDLTVAENLEIHGRLFGLDRVRRREQTARLLDYVELADRRDTPVRQLSGGMKRRVTIARSLMHEPGVLLLDEPTVGLDPNIRRRIWALIKRIQADGAAVLLTTHYIEEAEYLAGRVAFLDQGQLKAVDTPANLMRPFGQWAFDPLHDETRETVFFEEREAANEYAAGQTGAFMVRRVNLEDAFRAMTGRGME